ncbi:MAG TPA: Xaa-Pro peptidase family protein [Candidatus Dormibacteraeota bacterium]|jgi:Xaa-Pro dipeptidase
MRERDDLPFSMAEYRSRLERTRAAMDEAEVALLMSSTPENIYYLTGFNSRGYYSHQCLFVPRHGEPWMVVRQLDEPNVSLHTWLEAADSYRDADDPIAATVRSIRERDLGSAVVGLELSSWFLTAHTHIRLRDLLPEATFKDASGMIERLRIIKSPAEVEYTRQAGLAVAAGMRAAIDETREGALDSDVAAAAYRARILAGSEYVASPVYVQTGPGSAIPHNNWNGRRIARGDVTFYEMGASVRRYHCSLMRTSVVGAPSKDVARAGAAVVDGLEAALQAIRPKVSAGEVDAACRDLIKRAGFADNHTLRVGYHIGIGYPPTWVGRGVFGLNRGAPDLLEPGMVFHVIPWIHVPGVGGFGNSATVVVTDAGYEKLAELESALFVR